jgi:hypothetical protein
VRVDYPKECARALHPFRILSHFAHLKIETTVLPTHRERQQFFPILRKICPYLGGGYITRKHVDTIRRPAIINVRLKDHELADDAQRKAAGVTCATTLSYAGDNPHMW